MNLIKNRGMFLETIIDNWCDSMREQDIAMISKMPVNHKILSVHDNMITGVLKTNDYCDYIGIWNGNYIEFEAKETTKGYFNSSNLKRHQFNKLINVNKHGGVSFIVVYFHLENRYFMVNSSIIRDQKYKTSKKIPLSWFEDNGIELFLDGLTINIHEQLNNLLFN